MSGRPRRQAPRPGARNTRRTAAKEALLEALLAEESLERTLAAGLTAIPGVAAAALVFDEGRIVQECWYPADPARPAAIVEMAREMARRELRGETPSAPDAPPGLNVLPLLARGRKLGALCLVPADGQKRSGREIQRLASALACRAAADLELNRLGALQTRYERWFKTLDDQLRVLDRERQKFAALVHASGAGVFVTDPEGVIRWTNVVLNERPPAAGRTWVGLSCGDVCGGLHAHAGGRACDECPVAEVMNSRRVVHREFRTVRDGEVKSSYVTALPIKGPDGQVAEAMVMIQDLSDLEILRTSEARYRQLFDRSGRAIVMVDPETHRILLANPSAAALTGFEPQELLERRLEDLHQEEEARRLGPLYDTAAAGGDLEPRECRVLASDGTPRVTRVSGARTDLDGQEVLMIEFQDITESRDAAEALHVVEERLRLVVAASPIILFAIDRDGIYRVSEGRGLAAVGLEPGELVGRSVWEVWKNSPQVLANVRRALEGEEFSALVEIRSMSFEASYAPLRGSDGEIQGIIGVATDVTERHRLEGQLRQAQRMEAIGRLAGGVAHDFNNLLAAILGHTELIIGRLEIGHPMRRSAEEVQKAAVRGAMLTRQLLAFGRKETLSFQVLDVNAVVAGLESMLTRLIGEDYRLENVPAARPASVKADRGQLEQVVLNLVVNARDAMPHGGRIVVEVEHVMLDDAYIQRHGRPRSGPHVMVAVTDTGVGMDEDTLSHVFEPFYTTKARDKGTGLGLATVYGIVEQCQGHILVHSEPGKGTRFEIYLPLADARDVVVSDPPIPTPRPVQGGRETILLAEDEEAVRSLAKEVLESKGYTVIEARNGVEALEAAAAHRGEIHLLLTDVVMPQMGGGELAQRLMAERPDLKVLYMSGYPDDAVVSSVIRRGTTLLQKPFRLVDFVRRVRETLDEPKAQAA